MIHTLRAAFACAPRTAPLWQIHAASFHSTPVLERKKKSQWQSRFNYHKKRKRNFEKKKTLFHNLSEYADYLFKSWRDEDNFVSSREEIFWFGKPGCGKGTNRNGFLKFQRGNFRNKRGNFDVCTSDDDDDGSDDESETMYQSAVGGEQFCRSFGGNFDYSTSDDDEFETIFQSSFGGARLRWSYGNSKSSRWSDSSGQTYWESSRNRRYETDDENSTSFESDLASPRRALGLSESGPLKLEDVKNAYRSCALRWHPDRHQGSAKAEAEEKFKHCTAAYQKLCDRLVPANL